MVAAGDRHDQVDSVVAAWHRERPDIDPSPMHIWSRITRLAQILDAVRAKAYANHDLQGWEFDVLAALRRAGSPYRMTPGQLLKETHVTSGTMTNRIDRLTDRGLVNRLAHPSDGRGVLVELTDEGKVRVDAAVVDLIAAERLLSAHIDATEQSVLAQILRSLLVS